MSTMTALKTHAHERVFFWAPTDLNLLPVEILTSDPEKAKAEPSEGVAAQADPRPEVELELDSAEFNASGDLEVTVSGTVSDRLSEVLSDTASRVQHLRFFANGEEISEA